MSQATFTIAYDGPALRDHSIDVRTLAPALLSVGQLIDAANSVLNKDGAQTKTNVRALESGSFQVEFEVVQTLYERIITLFSGPEASAASNLLGLLGIGGIGSGLLYVIRWLKGKAPGSIQDLGNGKVRLHQGEESFEISADCFKLLQDLSVRDSLQRIIEEPLKQEGIDSFEVREKGQAALTIPKSEAIFFARPALPDKVLIDDRRQSAFSISSLTFKEENKWRLYDGTNTISATIADEDFISKVSRSEIAFAKGDVLVCDVHVVQKQTDAGLKNEYTVERVVKHIPGARQIPMDFSSD